jgi:ABC-2 type transport system ATP-binding protein
MAHISYQNVSIEYPIYNAQSMSLRNQIVDLGTGGRIQKVKSNTITVKALDDVSFDIKTGDRVGLVGHNGAGKSTLLRSMAGLLPPTGGRIEIEGKLSTVFQLGAGMDTELSGNENIIRMCLMLGLSLNEALACQGDIAEFTELGDFLNVPVCTYSAGMQTRLMFAVATSVQSDILLIDEILGAGDAAFIEKAKKRLDELVANARIFVLASHNQDIIKTYCNKIFHLNHGKVTVSNEI